MTILSILSVPTRVQCPALEREDRVKERMPGNLITSTSRPESLPGACGSQQSSTELPDLVYLQWGGKLKGLQESGGDDIELAKQEILALAICPTYSGRQTQHRAGLQGGAFT